MWTVEAAGESCTHVLMMVQYNTCTYNAHIVNRWGEFKVWAIASGGGGVRYGVVALREGTSEIMCLKMLL